MSFLQSLYTFLTNRKKESSSTISKECTCVPNVSSVSALFHFSLKCYMVSGSLCCPSSQKNPLTKPFFFPNKRNFKKGTQNTILSSCTPSISEPPFPQKTPKLNYIKSWGPQFYSQTLHIFTLLHGMNELQIGLHFLKNINCKLDP
jgi:hypothetical protein